jgi:hypothetical protein
MAPSMVRVTNLTRGSGDPTDWPAGEYVTLRNDRSHSIFNRIAWFTSRLELPMAGLYKLNAVHPSLESAWFGDSTLEPMK